MEYCPNKFHTDRSVHLIEKGGEMNMVIELNRLTCHPMPTPLVDILIHILPYPIKRIQVSA